MLETVLYIHVVIQRYSCIGCTLSNFKNKKSLQVKVEAVHHHYLFYFIAQFIFILL
jgi:hypothetical protein